MNWGEHDGQPVYLFKIINAAGAYIELTNYGATLVSVVVPDRTNNYKNVILGFTSLQGYIDDDCYIGSTIGRYANRIAGAKLKLDDQVYYLETNDGKNTNHGGNRGFNANVFNYNITSDGISFTFLSKDGDEGFPGNMKLTVIYKWSDSNELIITYSAETDRKTVANFTNHAYFNLSDDNAKIFDHFLTVYADNVLETNEEFIPTGLINPAEDIAFSNSSIRNKIMIDPGNIVGLNDCYILNSQSNGLPRKAARLFEKISGRNLEVFTTYPAIIVYTADTLQSKHPGNHLSTYEAFDGICLECQYFPDSPGHPNFPTTILEAGDIYNETIIYKFSNIEWPATI
jgi:aldose 1-epimerase